MIGFESLLEQEEELLAKVAQIAYGAVLKRGLARPFIEVELEIWDEIRASYVARLTKAPALAEVA
ncbi:MAG: hypothetical protein K2X38_05565 [Gemmataceae bacterium]|nr:hypothetical protein [Gemmataceae bacterium]